MRLCGNGRETLSTRGMNFCGPFECHTMLMWLAVHEHGVRSGYRNSACPASPSLRYAFLFYCSAFSASAIGGDRKQAFCFAQSISHINFIIFYWNYCTYCLPDNIKLEQFARSFNCFFFVFVNITLLHSSISISLFFQHAASVRCMAQFGVIELSGSIFMSHFNCFFYFPTVFFSTITELFIERYSVQLHIYRKIEFKLSIPIPTQQSQTVLPQVSTGQVRSYSIDCGHAHSFSSLAHKANLLLAFLHCASNSNSTIKHK